MTVNLKALILALALAVLPLRGVAAVALWCCAQNQAGGAAAAQADHGGGHHGHGEYASHADDHGAHHGTYQEANDPAPAADAPVSGSACGGCVAGSVGAAVAHAAWAMHSFPPPGASRIPFLEQRFTGIVPAQLERPPLAPTL